MLLLLWALSLPFLLGCVCGLRSMTGPAVICWAYYFHGIAWDAGQLSFLKNPICLGISALLAIGELVADKLPFIPRRTMAGPLAVRFVSGALCGTAMCLAIGADVAGDKWAPAVVAGLIGGIAAIASANIGCRLRRWLTLRRGLPDLPVALLEDAIAIGLGLYAALGGVLRS